VKRSILITLNQGCCGIEHPTKSGFAVVLTVQAYNLQTHVTGNYAKVLHQANVTNRKTAVVGGISLAYSQFVMFAMYSLITW
jgi:ATP-binding cassette subfamily B (MDR/TAP) protein 1